MTATLAPLRLVVPNAWQIAQAKAMLEDRGSDSLESHVQELSEFYQLEYTYHTHDSRRSQAGYPDWTLVGIRVLFRELKREGKNPTPAQRHALDALKKAGEDVGVWRPMDLFTKRIHIEMAAISPNPAFRKLVEGAAA